MTGNTSQNGSNPTPPTPDTSKIPKSLWEFLDHIFKDRVYDPFFRNYILFLLAWNWRAILAIFSIVPDEYKKNKVDFVSHYLSSWQLLELLGCAKLSGGMLLLNSLIYLLNILLIPLLITYLYIYKYLPKWKPKIVNFFENTEQINKAAKESATENYKTEIQNLNIRITNLKINQGEKDRVVNLLFEKLKYKLCLIDPTEIYVENKDDKDDLSKFDFLKLKDKCENLVKENSSSDSIILSISTPYKFNYFNRNSFNTDSGMKFSYFYKLEDEYSGAATYVYLGEKIIEKNSESQLPMSADSEVAQETSSDISKKSE